MGHDDDDVDDLQREEIVFAIKFLLLEYNQFVDHSHICAWASVYLVGEWREIVSVSRCIPFRSVQCIQLLCLFYHHRVSGFPGHPFIPGEPHLPPRRCAPELGQES